MTDDSSLMRRDVPEAVKRQLRQEVGFGCPVKHCREPFLSWHHFDPPWSKKPHHNPEGMIALCVKHHKMADIGVFTNADLHAMKKSSQSLETVKSKFEWARPGHLVRIGGLYLDALALMDFQAKRMPGDFFLLNENEEHLQELTFHL